MKRCAKLAVLAAFLATVPTVRSESDSGAVVALRDSAAVVSDVITLGDVAELRDDAPADLAGVRIGNAPWPGQVRKVTSALVQLRMVSAGYDPARFAVGGSQSCLVQTATDRVSPEAIVEAARRHIADQFGDSAAEVRIELLSDVPQVLLPSDEAPVELRPSLPGTGAPLGTVRVDVELLRGGARLRNIPLSFAVRVREEVAVATVNIGSGERLSDANVAFTGRDVGALRGACIRSPQGLAGKIAARPIRPGQVITDRMVGEAPKPLVIAPNQLVYVVVQTPSLRVTAVGKALTAARVGEVVTARNLATRKEMTGIAQPDSSIRILMEGQIHEILRNSQGG